jgi:Domain of unknown function (DUF4350)
MRQRLTIILTLVVIVGLLVLLNLLTYVKQDKSEDFEIAPNRSTYHSGPTGLRALHDFLNESGYKVIRWRETPQRLLSDSGKLVTTFVMVGQAQLPFTAAEAEALRTWVARGGRFVLIDRKPDSELAAKSAGSSIGRKESDFPTINVNPGDPKQMTEKVVALEPVQPTVLTSNIKSVLPSRFASRLQVERPAEENVEDYYPTEGDRDAPLPEATTSSASPAPVVHIADSGGALLVDYSYGLGNIVILSDPYVVANGGIRLNDNLQLAINILAARDGLIAFDEYHQGRGVTQSGFASYFAGTPVLAIALQIALLVLLVLWTNARRFGRPLPLPHVDRRSSLEFVASMAELQERSRAFDLAIENIYTRTRRILVRYAGMDYKSSRSEIAARIASRSSLDAHKLETLMRQCEEAINGGQINWRQSIDLVRRLREVEKELGLRMRSRDVRQAAENI